MKNNISYFAMMFAFALGFSVFTLGSTRSFADNRCPSMNECFSEGYYCTQDFNDSVYDSSSQKWAKCYRPLAEKKVRDFAAQQKWMVFERNFQCHDRLNDDGNTIEHLSRTEKECQKKFNKETCEPRYFMSDYPTSSGKVTLLHRCYGNLERAYPEIDFSGVVDRYARDYEAPSVLKQIEIEVGGFGEMPQKEYHTVDLVACDTGSVHHFSSHKSRRCEPLKMAPTHGSIEQRFYSCTREILQSELDGNLVKILNWGTYANRATGASGLISEHAYGAAIDVHGVFVNGQFFNFERARDHLRDAFDVFMAENTEASEISYDEGEDLKLEFLKSEAYRSLEFVQFWIPFMNCVDGAMAPFGLPDIQQIGDSDRYLPKSFRPKDKTGDHENHIHFGF